MVFIVCLCGAAAPAYSFEITGINMVISFPDDYVVFGQEGPMTDNAAAAGWDKESISQTASWLREDDILLYASQFDGYDNIYLDSSSYDTTLRMQDFTKYCAETDRSDAELLEALEEASTFRGANADITNYTNERAELVSVNGEKYGYSLGYFEMKTKGGMCWNIIPSKTEK